MNVLYTARSQTLFISNLDSPPALISHACAHVRSTGDTYCLKDGSLPSEVLVNNGLSATLELLQL